MEVERTITVQLIYEFFLNNGKWRSHCGKKMEKNGDVEFPSGCMTFCIAIMVMATRET